MGLISALAGVGGLMRGAGDLTAVVRGNKAEEARAQHTENLAALEQLGAEFGLNRDSWFDILIDGLNRLPRPALAMGTIGLFVYSMADPIGFADRMQGLQLVPDQLWWLLGAIVSFYFGARELHYFRDKRPSIAVEDLISVTKKREKIGELRRDQIEIVPLDIADPNFNAALEAWKADEKA